MSSDVFMEWREWILSAGAVAATFVIAQVLRTLFRRLGARGARWRLLGELAPSLASIVYVVGLSAAIDLAPLAPKLHGWLKNALYVLGILIFLRLLRRTALIGIEWSALRSSQSRTIQQGFIPLLRNIITLFIFLTGGIMVLSHLGYDVMSLLAALGVGSLAVGLAAKDTLSNMISGFTLIIDRNLTPGDRVSLGSGAAGEVEEIGLRSTRIRTGDGNTLIVPNTDLVNNKILNLSSPTDEVSCSAQLRVAYDVPFPRVRDLCLETIDALAKARRGKGRWANLASLADGHQLIQVGFWVESPDDQGAALSEFHEKILGRFRSDGITLVTEKS